MANRRVTNPSKTPSDAPKDVFMSPSSDAAWLEEVSLNLYIFFIFLWHTFLSCNLYVCLFQIGFPTKNIILFYSLHYLGQYSWFFHQYFSILSTQSENISLIWTYRP